MTNLIKDIGSAKGQSKQAIEAIRAVLDTIKELKEIPSGHLYAQLMPYMSLDVYNEIIRIGENCGLIENKNNLLKWKEVSK